MKLYFELFLTFLRLGCTSFGGPIAHIGYFHHEFVLKRNWLSDQVYSDLVALCQFLPGPASSQMGIAIGALRGGILGSVLAFLGFTLPSAILMTGFGLGLIHYSELLNTNLLHGLQIAALAVIVQALWQMGNKLCPDNSRVTLALTAAVIATMIGGVIGQLIVILIGGLIGFFFLKEDHQLPSITEKLKISKQLGSFFLISFILLLFLLPSLALYFRSDGMTLFDRFYRTGSLVFGGGHVVLSLLEEEIVKPGLVSNENFLIGYGLAQVVPGPLFTISAFIGAINHSQVAGLTGALLCLTAVFLPAYLLILGILPFWENLRSVTSVQSVLRGVNASVVGLLLAVFYNPLYIKSIVTILDFYLLAFSVVLLNFWQFPSWSIVLLCASFGLFIGILLP